MRRLNLRLTATQSRELEQLAETLGLRRGQVATRLVRGTLSRTPTASTALWRELGNTANNLQQVLDLVDDAPDAAEGSNLRNEVQELWHLVGSLRAELLGATPGEGRT